MQVLVNDTIVNYEQFGASPEHLVILHGWGRSLAEWRGTAFLCSKKYTVTIIDFPGFGASDEPNTAWDTYAYANFIKDFLLKIGIKKAVILGHSFGGRIATILSIKNPELISQIILVDSGGIEIKSLKTRILSFLNFVLKPIKGIFGKKIKSFFSSSDYKSISGVMKKVFTKVVNQDLRHLFSKVKHPVTLIWGSADNVLPVSYTKIYKKYIPQTVVKIVWGGGHSPYLSNPNDFFAIITDTLNI